MKRTTKRFYKIITLFFTAFGLDSCIFLIAFLLTFYSLFDTSFFTYEEHGRLLSPDGLYEAVLTIREPGAVGSPRNYLYLVPKGEQFREGEGNFEFPVFDGYGFDIDKIEWTGPRDFKINYENFRINDFQHQ